MSDVGAFEGRDAVMAIVDRPTHRGLVAAGCAHMSTVPYVVIDGDSAIATCHTMVPMHREDGFYIGRLSASRIKLARESDGQWRIKHRQNTMLDGNSAGPALLARLNDAGAVH